jgi:hypothetical protein
MNTILYYVWENEKLDMLRVELLACGVVVVVVVMGSGE